MGGIRTFAALASCVLVVTVAGCTSSSGGVPTATSSAPISSAAPTSTPASTPSTSTATSSAYSGPPRPTTPTLPSDVPTTGPNMHKGEKPPIMPLEATQHTGRGALAFAGFFVKTIDWSYATVNGSYVSHYALPSCTTCKSLVSYMARVSREHHRILGGRLTVTGTTLRAKPSVKGAEQTVSVKFNSNAFEELDAKRRFVQADGAHEGQVYDVSLRWNTAMWRVIEVELEV